MKSTLMMDYKEGSPAWLLLRGIALGREIETQEYHGRLTKEIFAKERTLALLALLAKQKG